MHNNFKEGDLVLFLPTKADTTKAGNAWVVFNVGAPRYYPRKDGHVGLDKKDAF